MGYIPYADHLPDWAQLLIIAAVMAHFLAFGIWIYKLQDEFRRKKTH
eukprot:CAMPEP_0114046152 /NCGR_PEP_ID=MMETSP1339-20121228/19194_1 /TAXON_ID=94617 /ORGANISM="Fibrocapsa japonica" /LENGTH=46 /assembly_acc=CAM_ASM_000762